MNFETLVFLKDIAEYLCYFFALTTLLFAFRSQKQLLKHSYAFMFSMLFLRFIVEWLCVLKISKKIQILPPDKFMKIYTSSLIDNFLLQCIVILFFSTLYTWHKKSNGLGICVCFLMLLIFVLFMSPFFYSEFMGIGLTDLDDAIAALKEWQANANQLGDE